jgi:hypothetical protein
VVKVVSAGKTIWPPAPSAVPIRIKKALWGPAGDEARTKDVTDQVQRMVDRVGPSFTVAELAAEGDPAVNIVKTLRVEYEAGGAPRTASATDPETITFATSADRPLPIRLAMDAQGRLIAECNESGTFTVIRRSGKRQIFRSPTKPHSVAVNDPWRLTFPPNWGAPPVVELPRLISWSDHADEGVRCFSGTATYSTTFNWKPPSTTKAGTQTLWELNLGRVEVMAQVTLNDRDLGILWRAPYAVDITRALKPGMNTLRVRVTNLWPNRMIGDEHLPEDSKRYPNGTLVEWPEWLANDSPSPTGRFTFTSWRLWKADSPLQPSGLMGPVMLEPRLRIQP